MRFIVEKRLVPKTCSECYTNTNRFSYYVVDTEEKPTEIAHSASQLVAEDVARHLEKSPNEKCDFIDRILGL